MRAIENLFSRREKYPISSSIYLVYRTLKFRLKFRIAQPGRCERDESARTRLGWMILLEKKSHTGLYCSSCFALSFAPFGLVCVFV